MSTREACICLFQNFMHAARATSGVVMPNYEGPAPRTLHTTAPLHMSVREILSGWARGAEGCDAQFVINTGKRAYIKTEVFYCPAMVFSSSQDINYFSFSGHTRRRGSALCGVRVMSSRVSRASTWSAYTHALPLCHLAICMCRFGKVGDVSTIL